MEKAYGITVDSLDYLCIVGTEIRFHGSSGLRVTSAAFVAKYSRLNTHAGDDVTMFFPDSDVSINFDTVTESGITTVESGEGPPPGAPAPPTGFVLSGFPTPIIFEITTTANYDGTITICIHYDETQCTNEENLQLWQYPEWTDITTSLDIENNIICGETTSFSWFAPMEPNPIIFEMIEDIPENVDHHGIATSLTSKLQSALKALYNDNIIAFEGIIDAFINNVEAQRGKLINVAYADYLIELTEQLYQ
jgi:hypothetical protein